MNTPVKFEIAKLLKEKGFNEEVRDYYGEKDGVFYHSQYYRDNISINKKLKGFVTAPTIAEVVMWLYEKHGIWIISSYELNIENHKKEWFWIAIKDGEEIAYQYRDFNSPTEAYEAAIKHTLENLIQGNKK